MTTLPPDNPEDPAQSGAPGMPPPPTGYGAPPSYGSAPGMGYPPAGPAMGAGGLPPLASWGQRAGATLVDVLIVVGLIIVAVVLGMILGAVSEGLGLLVLVLGYLGAVGFGIWQLIVQGQTGQTIGKKQLGIRLLREQDGQPIGGGMSVLRALVHIVDQLPCYVGYLWPLWDAKKQTFADKIMSTVVIKG